MCDVDPLSTHLPRMEQNDLKHLLSLSKPQVWGGLAVVTGVATAITVAVVASLPFLSLGCIVSAAILGELTITFAIAALLATQTKRAWAFLGEPSQSGSANKPAGPLVLPTRSAETKQIVAGCLALAAAAVPLLALVAPCWPAIAPFYLLPCIIGIVGIVPPIFIGNLGLFESSIISHCNQ